MPLAELLDLSLEPRTGEVVELLLERTDSDIQKLQLRAEGKEGKPAIPPKVDGGWLLSGTVEEVSTQISELSLVVGRPHAIGTFAPSYRHLGTWHGASLGAGHGKIGFTLEPDATPRRRTGSQSKALQTPSPSEPR